MKAFKLLIISLLVTGMFFTLVACVPTAPVTGDPEDDYTMEEAKQYVASLLPVYTKEDLTLPTEIENTTATITWQSSDEAVISPDGRITRGMDFQEITLSARIRLNGDSETVRQIVKVIPWEKPMPTNKKLTFGYYYASTSTSLDNIIVTKVDVINYAFGYLRNGVIDVSGLRFVDRIIELRERGVKVVLSVGGGGSSAGFSQTVANYNTRKILIDSILETIKKYTFSGVDIDWEYPGSGPEANPNDKQNFVSFLRELKAQLISYDPNLILTAAVGIDPTIIDDIDVPNVKDSLDYIHLMTYDFVTNSSVADAHLTNLYPSKYQASYSAHTAAMAYNYLGMPMEKIVIGAAFYGKIRNYNPDGSKTAYRTISYTDIKNQYLNNPDITYVWDEDAKAPLLINDTTFITFDDVNSIKAKCEYVKQNNLAGIMFWQYNHDETGDLLNAIYQNIRG